MPNKAETSALSTLSGRVDSAETAILNKANSSTVSSLDGRVGALESDMPGKASASSVSTVSGRVDSLESAMPGKAGSIPVTGMIYVDNKRLDTYVADGSEEKPYKLLSDVSAVAGQVIKLAPSTTSYGNVTLPDGVSLIGSGMHRTVLGNITTGSTTCDLADLQFTGKLTVNAKFGGENLFAQGACSVEVNNDINVGNFSIFATSGTPLDIKSGLSVFSRSTIKTAGNQPTVVQSGGSAIFSVCSLEGVSSGDVVSSTGGQMRIVNSSVINTGSLSGLSLDNGAGANGPNVLLGVMSPNNISCGNAVTMVGSIFGSGTLSGNALVYSIDNKSSLSGTKSFVDKNDQTHTVVIANGLITSWSIA